MTIDGSIMIGARDVRRDAVFHAVEAASGIDLSQEFAEANQSDVAEACALAEAASGVFGTLAPGARAAFLEAVSVAIEAIGDVLIETAMAETGLPRARLEGERGRTTGQLRMFAAEGLRWRLAGRGDRYGAARSGAAARRPAPDEPVAWTGRGLWRIELSAGFLGCGRRHGSGFRGRLPGRREGTSRAPRHRRIGGTRSPVGGPVVRPSRRRLFLSARAVQRTRRCAGCGSAHQGGRVHRLAQRRARAGRDCASARRNPFPSLPR